MHRLIALLALLAATTAAAAGPDLVQNAVGPGAESLLVPDLAEDAHSVYQANVFRARKHPFAAAVAPVA